MLSMFCWFVLDIMQYAYEKPNVQSRNLETKHTFSNSLNFAGHSKLFTA